MADVVSLWHVMELILEVPKGVGINSQSAGRLLLPDCLEKRQERGGRSSLPLPPHPPILSSDPYWQNQTGHQAGKTTIQKHMEG